MVQDLKDSRRLLEAALVLETYQDNAEEAIATLVEGHAWMDADRLIAKNNRADLLETHLCPALGDHATYTLNNLKAKRQEFETQFQRLTIVIDTKEKIASGLYDDVPDLNLEDADLYSEANSFATIASAISARKSNPASLKTR